MAAELQEGEPRQASLKAGGLGEGESSSSRVAQLSHLAIPTRDLLSWEESKKPLWGRLWRPGQNGAVRASVRGGGSCSRERQSPWNLVEGLGGNAEEPLPRPRRPLGATVGGWCGQLPSGSSKRLGEFVVRRISLESWLLLWWAP